MFIRLSVGNDQSIIS